METNQFVYKEKRKEGEETVEVFNSFNIDMVARAITVADGRVLVLLDDIHERLVERPKINAKGRPSGVHRVRETYQSEIYLSQEEGAQFFNLTAINNV